MRKVELSEEQRKAVLTPGNLVVRAGAGSGKTEVLARRFVALIAGDIEGTPPLSPEQVVAITFTEKATCDMKERIAEVLNDRLEAKNGADPVHLKRARRALPAARISTIHAFCARLLHENPLEAGLDPAFEVLDEYQSATFIERRCEQLLIDALRAGDPGASRLIAARRLRGTPNREGALELVMRLVGEMRRLGMDPERLRRAAIATSGELERHSSRERTLELRDAIEALLAGGAPLAGAKARERIDLLRERWHTYRAMLESFDANAGPRELRALRELCELIPNASGRIREMVTAIRSILSTDQRSLGLAGKLIGAYGAERAARPTVEVSELIAAIAEQLEEHRRREAVVTFDDLLVLTERVLLREPAVARRYRTALRAILVDEYQDTNPVQDSIVRLLTEPDGPGAPPQLFIVGDEKQSIYRFRGTDVTIFSSPRRPQPAQLTLRENRRSTSGILNFVNALSARLMRPPQDRQADAFEVVWDDRVHRLIPVRDPPAEPSVELVRAAVAQDDGRLDARAKREREAAFIAARVIDLVASHRPVFDPELKATREVAYRDIAILLRAFSDVAIYERALVEAGVPCYTVKGRGFYGCREVLDLADLVGAIDDRRDSTALAAVLRSPLFALSDPCLLEIGLHARAHRASLAGLFSAEAPDFAWLKTDRERAEAAWRTLKELRAMVRRSSLVEVLERALEATDFEAVMLAQSDGAQRAANIRKLAELALSFQASRCFTFADFAAHLRRLVDESPDEPQAQILAEGQKVVRIMTIHQAKGLEFPVVIVADIGRGAPPREHNYLLSPERGLLMREAVGSGGDELPNPLVEEHLERVSRMEKAEAARLLYVAMTRARDLLILSEGSERGDWARQVREFVAEGAGEFPRPNGAERIIEAHGARILIHARGLQRRSIPAGVEKRAGADELAGLARARLGFSPPPDIELIASPTELADFERCPRQYQLRHVLELPEGASFGAEPGHAIEMGIVAHAVLERLDRGLAGRTLEDETARLVGAMAAGKGLDAGRRAALARDIVRYAGRRERAERIVGREVPFFLSVAESDVALFVRGRIDVIVERDGRLVVRDYKYARGEQAEPQTYRVQMECYALAAQSALPGRPVDAELIFIRDRVSVARLAIADAEEIRSKLAALGRAALAAARTDQYPIKPTGPEACRRLGCGYIRRCWGAD